MQDDPHSEPETSTTPSASTMSIPPVQRLVFECIQRMDDEGEAAIEATCAAHPEHAEALRDRLEALRRLGLLGEGIGRIQPLPERIGDYKILRRLGAGGMGIVFEAEQEQPRRRVALKVIRSSSLDDRARRRFAYEAQLLALLRHPDIARIYEAGTTMVGAHAVPFFSMELVEGQPLDEFVREHDLPVEHRVRLMVSVARAVGAAHCAGVIHRDLKPANVLVQPDGRPKVLDFGLARASDPDLSLSSLGTQSGQLLGTLAYMSPEQAQGDWRRVDARTDVYSLGVILYRILTGEMPYGLDGLSTMEAVRRITEQQPPRLGSVNPTLRGDLEAITATALHKDLARRYASADALAADLERHLRREPVLARPPSTLYLLGKTISRHRGLSAALLLAFLLLLVGATVSTWQWSRAAEREREAHEARGRAEREVELNAQIQRILGDMLLAPDPWVGRSGATIRRDTRIRDVLLDTVSRLDQEEQLDPEVELTVRARLGTTFRGLGLFAESVAQLARAVELSRSRPGGSRRTAMLLASLGTSHADRREWEPARAALDEAIELLQPDGPVSLPLSEARGNLAYLQYRKGDYEIAERSFEQALQSCPDTDEGAANRAWILGNYGALLQETRRPSEAEPVLQEALRSHQRELGEAHPLTQSVRNVLSLTLDALDRPQEALAMLEEVVRHQRETLGLEHLETQSTLANLGSAYLRLGRRAEAEDAFRELIDAPETVVLRGTMPWVTALGSIAALHHQDGDHVEAVALLEPAIEQARAALGRDNHMTAFVECLLGKCLLALQRDEEALDWLRVAVEDFDTSSGPQHPDTQAGREMLIFALRQTDHLEEAAERSIELLQGIDPLAPPDAQRDRLRRFAWAILAQADALEDLELELLDTLEALENGDRLDSPLGREVLSRLVRTYEAMLRPEEAQEIRARLDDLDR